MKTMVNVVVVLVFALLLASVHPADARIEYRAPKGSEGAYQPFFKNVSYQLQLMKTARDSNMQAFYEYVIRAPGVISIQPVTDDPATWLENNPNNKNRCHVKWIPSQSRPNDRDAILYMVPQYVDPSHKSFRFGTLPHELVHATDYTYGHFHQERQYRERRGVFVENIWRDMVGHPLRTNYHNRFDTLDYQKAKAQGEVETILRRYIFQRSDLP